MAMISLSILLIASALAGCATQTQPLIEELRTVSSQDEPTGIVQSASWKLIFRYPKDFPTNTPWWYLLYSTNLTSWDFYPQPKWFADTNGLWVTNELPWCYFRIVAVK